MSKDGHAKYLINVEKLNSETAEQNTVGPSPRMFSDLLSPHNDSHTLYKNTSVLGPTLLKPGENTRTTHAKGHNAEKMNKRHLATRLFFCSEQKRDDFLGVGTGWGGVGRRRRLHRKTLWK